MGVNLSWHRLVRTEARRIAINPYAKFRSQAACAYVISHEFYLRELLTSLAQS